MFSYEPPHLACRRFRWRDAQRVRLSFPQLGAASKKLSSKGVDRQIQESTHRQLSQAKRTTFRGNVAIEISIFGTHLRARPPQIHAAIKWLLDLLGEVRHRLPETRRQYLLFKDDRQVKYLCVEYFPDHHSPHTYITARSMAAFWRDLQAAGGALVDLDDEAVWGKHFSPNDVVRYDLYSEDMDELSDFLGEARSPLEAHYKMQAQGYFAESARFGLSRINSLHEFTRIRRHESLGLTGRLSPNRDELFRQVDEIVSGTVDWIFDWFLGDLSLRLNLSDMQWTRRGRFHEEVGSLFRRYRRRYGNLGTPLYLSPALEIVNLEANPSAYSRRDLDNILRRVLGIFHQEVDLARNSPWASVRGSKAPLFCEVLTLPEWHLTGRESLLSIGVVPGPPFHRSIAQEIDNCIDLWSRLTSDD